ncbi:MAG TPA: hypothetical protein VN372_00070 [Methanospirillum sp.]|nr:hypothetical protein [Methanospirillum sp.]
MELTSIILALTTVGAAVWGVLTRWDLLDNLNTRNDQLNAIVKVARKEAVATDFYIRSMADGKLTIEEGEQFKTFAADAIVSHLTAVEAITGKQIYNRPEVPLPLPIGGKRMPDEVQPVEQPIQLIPSPVSSEAQPA